MLRFISSILAFYVMDCFCPFLAAADAAAASTGLPSHPQHEVSKKQTTGFGGMVSFRIKGTLETAKKFIASLKVAVRCNFRMMSCFSHIS